MTYYANIVEDNIGVQFSSEQRDEIDRLIIDLRDTLKNGSSINADNLIKKAENDIEDLREQFGGSLPDELKSVLKKEILLDIRQKFVQCLRSTRAEDAVKFFNFANDYLEVERKEFLRKDQVLMYAREGVSSYLNRIAGTPYDKNVVENTIFTKIMCITC